MDWVVNMALVLCVQLLYCKAMFTLIRSLSKLITMLIVGFAVTPLAAQQYRQIEQGYPGIRLDQLHGGLGVPWGMTFLGPKRLLLAERSGKLRLLHLDTNRLLDLRGAPRVVAEGQGGMLDVDAGPNYAEDGWIYFTYSKRSKSEAVTTLARALATVPARRLARPVGHRFRHRYKASLR